jgi:chromosome partitioning protein
MQTICFANQKGGVGKTTGALSLFWHLADRGYRVMAIDLDQQANMSSTLAEHGSTVTARELFRRVQVFPKLPSAALAHATPDLTDIDEGSDDQREEAVLSFRDNLAALSEQFDAAIIDTPPAIHIMRTIAALFVSTAIVAPIELADYSIQGVATLRTTLDKLVDLGREPVNFLGLLPSKFDRRSPREIALYQQLQAEFSDVLFPGYITKRDAYARAGSEGRPVWKMPGTASREAAVEIRAVMEMIEQRVGLRHGAVATTTGV